MILLPSTFVPGVSKRGAMLFAGLLLISCSAFGQKLVTSFEGDEGFTPGKPAVGQADWTGSETDLAKRNIQISDAEAYRGKQSLAVDNSAGKFCFVQTTSVEKLGLNAIRFYFKNPEAAFLEPNQVIARWEVAYEGTADSPKNRIAMMLRYSTDKTYHIHFSSPEEALVGTGNRNIRQSSSLNLTDWNELAMKFDFAAKTLTVTVNGATLSSGLNLKPEKTPDNSRIVSIRFATPSEPTTGITYYDVVEEATE